MGGNGEGAGLLYRRFQFSLSWASANLLYNLVDGHFTYFWYTYPLIRTVRVVLVNRFAENLFRARKPSQSVIVVPSSLGVFDSQGSARAPGLHLQ